MDVKIQQWGTSAGLRVPSTVLKELDISSGDTLTLDIADGSIVLKPISGGEAGGAGAGCRH